MLGVAAIFAAKGGRSQNATEPGLLLPKRGAADPTSLDRLDELKLRLTRVLGEKKKGTAMTELTAARRRGGKQEKERLFDAEEGSGGGGGALPPPWVKAAGSTPTPTPAVGTDADSLD